MVIDFNSKLKKRATITEVSGLVRFIIPDFMLRMDKSLNLSDRADLYREFLGINNALFFSEDVNKNGVIVSESLIVLDIHHEEYKPSMKMIFAENGMSGKYTVPTIDLNTLICGGISIIGRIINDKDRFTQFIRDMNKQTHKDDSQVIN